MEEIINSVMQSPENTNPNVLRGQLQSIGSSSGGGWNPHIVEIIGQGTGTLTTDADFDTAKAKFLANEPVLARMESIDGSIFIGIFLFYIPQEATGDKELLGIEFSDSVILFNSDGTITIQ